MTALVVPGLFATVALPAYAAGTSATSTTGQQASVALQHKVRVDAQAVVIDDVAPAAGVQRDHFGATSVAELKRKQFAAKFASYSGPTVAAFLKNPPHPHFSLSSVVSVAKKYTGTPYVYGGANPSGFDCSGFTQYVYAQFGISLPHSAAAQGSMGTAISKADARPGDVVVIDGGSHVGIYLGGNSMIDAPEPGGVVKSRAIWTSSYYIVRFGI